MEIRLSFIFIQDITRFLHKRTLHQYFHWCLNNNKDFINNKEILILFFVVFFFTNFNIAIYWTVSFIEQCLYISFV